MAGLFQSTEATIPPGVPDYALARTFGLTGFGPNSPLAKASVVGNGQVQSGLGGIVSYLNKGGPLASLVANQGMNTGSALDNFVARLDQMASNGQALHQFFAVTTQDAQNLTKGFSNLGLTLGRVVQHMPGEIEVITQGFRNVTGWAADALGFKAGGISPVGAGLEGLMLLHGTKLIANLLGKGIPQIGLKGLSSAPGVLGEFGGYLGGLGMFSPEVLLAGGAIAGGMALNHYQSPTSAAIKAIWGQNFNGAVTPAMLGNQLGAFGGFLNSAAYGSKSRQPGLISWMVNNSIASKISPGLANWLTFGAYDKSLSSSQLNANQAWFAQSSMMNEGGAINAIAKSLHISTAQAAMLFASSGAQLNAQGSVTGGNNRAIQLARNYLIGHHITSGGIGAAFVNTQVGQMVGDSAWKAAGQINSNWDAYIGAMAGGGTGLGNMWSVLANVAPSAAKNLAITKGFVPTSQAISSAGQPMIDFFRQAQSVGAIGSKSLGQSILQVAASMAPLAGNSKAAQAELVALARESGLAVPNFQALMKMTGGAAAAQKDLANSAAGTSTAMANLSPNAVDAMQKIQGLVNGAIDAAIQKSPAAYKAFNNLTTAMENSHTPASVMKKDVQDLIKNLHGIPQQEVLKYLQQLGINISDLPGYKKITIDLELQTNLPGNNLPAPTASQLGGMIFGRGTKRAALGTTGAAPGWSWVGENGPELAYFHGGEKVIPSHIATRVATGYAGGTGYLGGDVHIYIDGHEVFGAVKSRTYQYNINNGNRDSSGRPRATMRPRG